MPPSSMIDDEYFTLEDLAAGLPTNSKMKKFHDEKYRCHAIKQTMFIAANVDVYPCCHLYDDNVETSTYRARYKLGSLRINGIIPDITKHPNNNSLAKIWYGSTLKVLREKILPIEDDACGKCTRHIRHNDCANQINKVYEGYLKERKVDLSITNDKPWQPPKDGTWV